ncbi:transcription termination factor 5, mitochondrial-like [Epargyreus clarus]|uniref:transcription termination factor 5, mitochondrial-like n=1 Tax=Epargyreus clarus TaxID=520877 RepID=UPI003C2BD533
MILRLLMTKCFHHRVLSCGSKVHIQVKYYCQNEKSLQDLCKYLNISESQARFLQIKNRCVKKLNGDEIKNLVKTVNELGFPSDVVVNEPSICSILPVTLKFRYRVLEECGVLNLSVKHLVSYMSLIKEKTIGELKTLGVISPLVNIENKLANCMTQWPTSLTTLVYGDVDKLTLYSLRLKIIQRYLELILDITEIEFSRGLKIYPTLKHRPLAVINETLSILQTKISMPTEKIKSNFYLIHADPDNMKHILFKLRSIGGIDIKEVIRRYPKLAVKSYTSLLEIRNVLEEFGISNEAQTRCFQIYTLSPQTVKERLEKARSIPEFKTFLNHPRFLKMIHYNNTAMKRLRHLYDMNKKCLSLNVLSGSTAHYEIFEKAPGDRLGKGKDLVFCISESLGNAYSMNDIRKRVKRHPFWINIPLVQVKYVYEKLSTEFSPKDIYENCPILLYPWNKVKDVMNLVNKSCDSNQPLHLYEFLDLQKLSNTQKLSLILYLLEKNHYFSGNGVWNDEKNKNIDTVSNILVQNKNALIQ